jgi:hypothetical protein
MSCFREDARPVLQAPEDTEAAESETESSADAEDAA